MGSKVEVKKITLMWNRATPILLLLSFVIYRLEETVDKGKKWKSFHAALSLSFNGLKYFLFHVLTIRVFTDNLNLRMQL